jgi:hypothetical protein
MTPSHQQMPIPSRYRRATPIQLMCRAYRDSRYGGVRVSALVRAPSSGVIPEHLAQASAAMANPARRGVAVREARRTAQPSIHRSLPAPVRAPPAQPLGRAVPAPGPELMCASSKAMSEACPYILGAKVSLPIPPFRVHSGTLAQATVLAPPASCVHRRVGRGSSATRNRAREPVNRRAAVAALEGAKPARRGLHLQPRSSAQTRHPRPWRFYVARSRVIPGRSPRRASHASSRRQVRGVSLSLRDKAFRGQRRESPSTALRRSS